eukprot:CAMPEP_0171458174 /NCGR_PEP_ID=MMETSP0945-20130129/3960_1 /TAXON_ID=109269 /ORGANISM="Vaucheria litorea, Strain CCMP2940" /LENGTH=93 /DNA_ID=CAMNT_0011983933 /DNA_START=787 /DNA_END=1068 /DNA_ORIENTATION=-
MVNIDSKANFSIKAMKQELDDTKTIFDNTQTISKFQVLPKFEAASKHWFVIEKALSKAKSAYKVLNLLMKLKISNDFSVPQNTSRISMHEEVK